MPAPTPIQIRYGMDPTTLGGLAFTAGTARRQYSEYQTQLANDQAFLRNEISRRTEDTRFRNNFNLSLLGMQANERAARAQATALQEASGFNQRQAAQRGVPSPSRVGQPISLVPAEGPIDGTQPGGGGSVSFRTGEDDESPETYFFGEGKVTRTPGGEVSPDQMGGFVEPGPQERMVTQETRSALQQMQLLKDAMPPEVWQPIYDALMEGSLDPSKLGQTLAQRQATQTGRSGMTGGESVAKAARRTYAQMRSIESIPDQKRQVEEMLRFLNFKVGSREYARAEQSIDDLWDARWAGVEADLGAAQFTPPQTGNRQKRGSRENPIQLSHHSQVEKLAPGTYFINNKGEVMQRQ